MEEMYGEPFQVPSPDETIFTSWFEGGETFRSGLLYKRGNGQIFYFRPGHETYPTYLIKTFKRSLIMQYILLNQKIKKYGKIFIHRLQKVIDQNLLKI